MEAKTGETSSVRKRKVVDVTQLVKSNLLVELNKKQRRHVVTVSEVREVKQCSEATVREANIDDNAVCASPRCSGSDHVDDGNSCCSSNGSSELKFVDLEDDGDDEESDEVESQTYNPLREIRRQMAPSTNIQPQPPAAEPRREKMPTELELEEFFTAAEKDIQSKFSKKYNYDVTKDKPLEGRYEWTRVKP